MDNLGMIIKVAREKTGLTQKQLAEKTGLATVTIGQYERGGRHPGSQQLQLIADALGVPVQIFSQQALESSSEELLERSWRAPYIADPSEGYIPGVDDEFDESERDSSCMGEEDGLPIIAFGPSLGENIRMARKAAGLTQTQLANKVGVALGTIQQYETGRRQRPRVQHLQRLAEVFGVSVYDLAPPTASRSNESMADEATERIRLEVEAGYLENHHCNQWLCLMTRDGKEKRYFHGELNDVLYEMTPETIKLVTAFAKFIKEQEEAFFREALSDDGSDVGDS